MNLYNNSFFSGVLTISAISPKAMDKVLGCQCHNIGLIRHRISIYLNRGAHKKLTIRAYPFQTTSMTHYETC